MNKKAVLIILFVILFSVSFFIDDWPFLTKKLIQLSSYVIFFSTWVFYNPDKK